MILLIFTQVLLVILDQQITSLSLKNHLVEARTHQNILLLSHHLEIHQGIYQGQKGKRMTSQRSSLFVLIL